MCADRWWLNHDRSSLTSPHTSGASVHFVDHLLQRLKRDVDVLSGYVIFDYDTTRDLVGALAVGLTVPRTAML